MLYGNPLNPNGSTFGAQLSGLAFERLDAQTREHFINAMDLYGVTVLRDVPLSNDWHIAFSRLLGSPEPKPNFAGNIERLRLPYLELFDISNLNQHGEIMEENDRRRLFRLANEMWHTDSSYRAGGASYSLLAAYVIPSAGADTEFADMRAAYEALPASRQRELDGLVVEHSIEYSRALIGYQFDQAEKSERPPVHQYLVQVNPRTGRKSLYLANYASHVVGMDRDAGRSLLDELTAFATQERFIYRHKWRVGDLVTWDNRCTMHRATPFDGLNEKRDLRRTTLYGDLPVPETAQEVHP